MNTANPYAPPRAAVADVEDRTTATAPVRNWSAQGRIGRLRYLAHLMVAYLLVIVAGAAGGFLGAMLKSEVITTILIGVGTVAYFVFMVLKTIQRSHDMDWSGWTSLLALIPLVGLIWLVKGGTRGQNRFGPPTPANTLGVKILGLMLPAVMVVGILAAVALPAYQDYTNRARAAQQR